MADTLRRIFLNSDSELRFIWRAVFFYALGSLLAYPIFGRLFGIILGAMDLRGLSAGVITVSEILNFLIALICTGVFAYFERRGVDSYGLAVGRALNSQTVEGAMAGVLMAGAVAVGMFVLGDMQIKGMALTGGALAASAFAWLGANICVGIAEEFWFRSYFLQTLWKSIGFWPAAIVVALLFAADHYFFKQGENIWDVITLVSLSLLLSYTMLRTGTLWFAVGFHIAFDYMQLFVIGTKNGNQVPVGRLLDTTFNGPQWLTGGVLGTEASLLMYPAIALLWLYVWWRYRANPPLEV